MKDIVERLMEDGRTCTGQHEREAYYMLGNLLKEAAEEIVNLRKLNVINNEEIDSLEEKVIYMSDWRNL